MINLQAAVAYDPAVDTTEVNTFVGELMGGDDEMTRYLRRALGYSVTGEYGEHLWFLAYGVGSNGKSLLLEKSILPVLGGYAMTALRRTLVRQRYGGGGNKGELLAYEGRRYVLLSEMADELDPDRVKSLAAGGVQTDVALFTTNKREFTSVSKLWIDTNHKPRVTDDSEGFWRRVRMFPFEQRFKVDLAYEKRIMGQREAWLAWLVKAAQEYYQHGLGTTPKKVLLEIERYREETDDPVRDFARALKVSTTRHPTGQVFRAFQAWAHNQGYGDREIEGRQKAFSRRLGEIFPEAHRHTRDGWAWFLDLPGEEDE
jgi:putative DNA primase/helicase